LKRRQKEKEDFRVKKNEGKRMGRGRCGKSNGCSIVLERFRFKLFRWAPRSEGKGPEQENKEEGDNEEKEKSKNWQSTGAPLTEGDVRGKKDQTMPRCIQKRTENWALG